MDREFLKKYAFSIFELPSWGYDNQHFEKFYSLVKSQPGGFSGFREFLDNEGSVKTLEFWLAVENYKRAKKEDFKKKAHFIFAEFIATDSNNQVNNIHPELRYEIEFKIFESTKLKRNLFERAQRQIQYWMEFAALPKYLKRMSALPASGGRVARSA